MDIAVVGTLLRIVVQFRMQFPFTGKHRLIYKDNFKSPQIAQLLIILLAVITFLERDNAFAVQPVYQLLDWARNSTTFYLRK